MSLAAHTLSLKLPELTDITRYCRVEEIEPFLQMIAATVKSDFNRIAEWRSKQGHLVASIEQADGATLRTIHESLNQIELERFLLIPSVNQLHNSCTGYRDRLSARVMAAVSADMDAAGWVVVALESTRLVIFLHVARRCLQPRK